MLKRLTTWMIIISCICVSTNSWAALSSAIVWEVRSAGATTAGCGFKSGASGTDYSQQDAAQISRTDLVIGNPDTTSLTSSATAFTTAEIGNLIQITAGTGFTTGFYEITAVNGSNVATVDRATGTAGSTGGTGAVGGACNHPDTMSASVVAGNTVHIKIATYVKVGANAYVLNTSVAGGNGLPIIWEGYNTTRGDWPTGANRPVLDGGTNTTNVISGNFADNIFKNFIIKRAAADCITNNAARFTFVNSQITDCGDDGLGGASVLYNCEVDTNIDEGLDSSDADNHILYYTYVHNNSGAGVLSTNSAAGASAAFSIFDTNVGDGFHSQRNVNFLIGNVSYNNSGAAGDGFDIDGATTAVTIPVFNNISQSNGQYAFNRDATTNQPIGYFDYNIYNGHTTELNNITAGPNDPGDVDPSFNNAAAGDFTFSASSSPAVGAGIQQSYPGATGDYSWNIGVDQGDHTTGGGASAHTFVGGF